jgi:uncharacterized protein (TIGR00255 family)
MINSMTGFGRGEVARDGHKVVIEISSVNGRHLEVSMRLPRWLLSLEAPLKAAVGKRLNRGKVFCQLTLEREETAPTLVLNEPLADWYIETLKGLADKHNLSGGVEIGHLTRLPDLWIGQTSAPDDHLESVLFEALSQATDQLVTAREAEGKALGIDLLARLKLIGEKLEAIKAEAERIPEAIREKLTARIEELIGSDQYDPQRLAQEIAYIAERADITEECVRLEVHLQHFEEALNSGGAVGRRLNFLLQEMNRETNTIGSKSQNIENSSAVVMIKEELERIREQVQNIE